MKKLDPNALGRLPYLNDEELAEFFPRILDNPERDEEDRETNPFGLTLKEFLDGFDEFEDELTAAAFAPVTTANGENPLHACLKFNDAAVDINVYFRSEASLPVRIVESVIGTKKVNPVVVRAINSGIATTNTPTVNLAALAADSPKGRATGIHMFSLKIDLPVNWNLIAAELHKPHPDWSPDNLATPSGEPDIIVDRRIALLSCSKVSNDEYELMTNANFELLGKMDHHLVLRISKEA